MKTFQNKKKPLKKRIFKEIRASWWVFVFSAIIYVFSCECFGYKNREIGKLRQQLTCLEGQKIAASAYKKQLVLQIESQQDPAWIEIMLMKKLGVVPEGQLKVRFKKEGEIVPTYFEGIPGF